MHSLVSSLSPTQGRPTVEDKHGGASNSPRSLKSTRPGAVVLATRPSTILIYDSRPAPPSSLFPELVSSEYTLQKLTYYVAAYGSVPQNYTDQQPRAQPRPPAFFPREPSKKIVNKLSPHISLGPTTPRRGSPQPEFQLGNLSQTSKDVRPAASLCAVKCHTG